MNCVPSSTYPAIGPGRLSRLEFSHGDAVYTRYLLTITQRSDGSSLPGIRRPPTRAVCIIIVQFHVCE